jgi:hypothetical protein
MKQTTVAIAVIGALALSACSSNPFSKSGVDAPETVALKNQTLTLSTEFKGEGVKVYYTLLGNVDRVEAIGFAPVWQSQYEHIAELEAKDKLIKFLRGESVTTARKTEVIGKSIERAQDSQLNRFKNTPGAVDFVAEDLEAEKNVKPNPDENSRTNTALRKASINIAQTATSTITVNASGKLLAVAKKEAKVINDGKTYAAVYVWSPKAQEAVRSITSMMDGN